MKPWIVFDIDESIADLIGALISTLNPHLPTPITRQSFARYKLPEACGLEPYEWYQLMEAQKTYDAVTPYEGTVQALRRLHDRGLGIQLVTARGQVIDKTATPRWLENHGIPFDDLVITMPGEDKTDYYHPAAEWVIEDSVTHLQNASARGLSCIRVSHPWNADARGDWHTVQPHEVAGAIDTLALKMR